MTHDAKIHVQPESNKKQKGHKPPIQSQKAATPNLANLTQTGLQHMSRADILALQRTIGNRAVARLMAQREGENQEEIPGPRMQRQVEEEEEIEGPRTQRQMEEEEDLGRMKPLREDAVQQRGGSELMSSPDERGVKMDKVAGLGDIGDAFNLDGQGLYGWDRPMSASDVANVVNNLVPNTSSPDMPEPDPIVIFSGTHGTATGNLVNTGAGAFVGEDQATATAAMAASPGAQIEVIDVNTYSTRDELISALGTTSYIRIAAWCYSKRSYNNLASITANWWAAP